MDRSAEKQRCEARWWLASGEAVLFEWLRVLGDSCEQCSGARRSGAVRCSCKGKVDAEQGPGLYVATDRMGDGIGLLDSS